MRKVATDLRELLTLFGWLALIDALRVINEKDPGLRTEVLSDIALTKYVARRRDVLLHHHCPQWQGEGGQH